MTTINNFEILIIINVLTRKCFLKCFFIAQLVGTIIRLIMYRVFDSH